MRRSQRQVLAYACLCAVTAISASADCVPPTLRAVDPAGLRGDSLSFFPLIVTAGPRAVYIGYPSPGAGTEPTGIESTPSSIQLLADLTSGAGGSNISLVSFVGGRDRAHFMLNASGRIWSTDGTAAGTVQLPLLQGGFGLKPRLVGTLGTRQIISARKVVDPGFAGVEPYITDGTVAGTQLVRDIMIGDGGAGPTGPVNVDSNPKFFTEHDGRSFFYAESVDHGVELWVTDGTSAGTHEVADLNTGAGDCWTSDLDTTLRRPMCSFNGSLYFAAQTSGTSRSIANNIELWQTDGNNVAILTDLTTVPGGSKPDFLTATPLGMFFVATGPTSPVSIGRELYITDGTPTGTRLVKDITVPGSTTISAMAPCGNGVIFIRDQRWVWFSDGTADGTQQIAMPVEFSADSYNAPEVFSHRGRAYFRGYMAGTVGVVSTDGTPAGTCLLPVNPASFSNDGSNGWSLVLARNRLICDSSNTVYGHEIHVADLCPGDFDNSGDDPQIDDLFGYLNAWFSYTDTADVDHGGTIDVSDVFLFLNAWFNGCA